MAAGFPKKLSNPLGWGTRLARWEGDTLVVDTAGFNDKTWLDLMGHPLATPYASPSDTGAATAATGTWK